MPNSASATGPAAGRNGSGSRTLTAAHALHYAPLPLRVVNEDYALVAGFLGGALIFVVYVGVLICLRCLQQAQTAQRTWQTRRPLPASAQPHNGNGDSGEAHQRGAESTYASPPRQPPQLRCGTPSPAPHHIPKQPPQAAAAAARSADASTQRLCGEPPGTAMPYERGVPPLRAADPPAAPQPPPRRRG
ncbi:hypothetical protein ABL78_1328 [Leptomonas seymouri]|uniref:Uncharacterized protein n=1 Tax=Leptomonas seymouri TaxID=5684 RepID=A0A0N1I932_LEPSE|nr:hypothetical protein ABL78_1328 [Leptomonas seymouri]|eukprot:KPI89560.1 hypothetical protein ABL78_1328 [Leptomonas seymouri]